MSTTTSKDGRKKIPGKRWPPGERCCRSRGGWGRPAPGRRRVPSASGRGRCAAAASRAAAAPSARKSPRSGRPGWRTARPPVRVVRNKKNNDQGFPFVSFTNSFTKDFKESLSHSNVIHNKCCCKYKLLNQMISSKITKETKQP